MNKKDDRRLSADCKHVTCRCAFLPIDTHAGHAQVEKVLQQAQPCTLIWASLSIQGGAGPVDTTRLSAGCHTVQMPALSKSAQGAADAARATAQSSKMPGAEPAVAQNVHEQLVQEVADWQAITVDKPQLPFCYVMYTSGSTGSPAGVCGTEAGVEPITCSAISAIAMPILSLLHLNIMHTMHETPDRYNPLCLCFLHACPNVLLQEYCIVSCPLVTFWYHH